MHTFTTFLLSCLSIIITTLSFSQQESAIEQWEELLNKPKLAEYFNGIFEDMGFIVEETGETFTVHHGGDHFTINSGIVSDEVDYIVRLHEENIQNMRRYGADSEINASESYKIMSLLFTPLTVASLSNPTLSKPMLRKMSGIDNHIHVNLLSPDYRDTTSHTLIFINRAWMVIPGKHGTALRTFNLTEQDAIEYQRQVFIALKANNMKSWKQFKRWYMIWRKKVSEVD